MSGLPTRPAPTRIFLSYARGDDEPFVRRLHADLAQAGFTVWFDRESLMSRGLSFHQEIKDAIRTEVDRLVYVGGPKAALSPNVREEWQFALECDHVVVTPIVRLGGTANVPGELRLLHCEDFRENAHYPRALAKLVADLRQPNPPLGALFAVPSLPPNFLGRPELMDRVRDALLIDLQKAQVITGADARVGMQGMGGIGKSVLAAALARHRQIRQAYPDGIAWISCGQGLTDDDLLAHQRDLAHHLGGDATFASLAQGQAVLRDLLAPKAVLLVLDDVWRAADARTFDLLGPRGRLLVTTRDKGILDTLHGELVPVSLFTDAEAQQLLADAIGVVPADLPAEAHEVAHECGNLPLALALCGGMAGKRGGDFHSVLERLRRADLEKIADRESINEQHRSLWRAMQASVEVLSDDEQRRFAELAVFATDQTVPAGAAATLWSHTGDLDDLDTEDLLIELAERSLVQLDQETAADGQVHRRFRLHDLLHDYAVRIAGKPRAVHQILLDAYRRQCPDGWHTGPEDGYFFQNLCQHLAGAAGNWDAAVELLCDLRFVEARCRVGQVFELIADYRLARENLPEAQEDLRAERAREERVRRWTAEIIEYSRQWSERRDRLARGDAVTEPEPLLPEPVPTCEMWSEERIQAECDRIINSPTRRDRLEAFAGFVGGQCYPLFEHGRLPGFVLQHAFNAEPEGVVHGAAVPLLAGLTVPHLLRRWPPDARANLKPALLRTLKKPDDDWLKKWSASVSMMPDGRHAVSGGSDIRVWDLDSGQCLRTLERHSYRDGDRIASICVTPDGQKAVDDCLGVWDLKRGKWDPPLTPGRRMGSVSVTPDGRRAVLGNPYRNTSVWDLESGQCLRDLTGEYPEVRCVSVTPDGQRAVAGHLDNTLRVWDLESGQCLRILERHGGWIMSVDVTPDGQRAVSGHGDNMLRVWDIENGQCLRVLTGHSLEVRSVSVTSDGRRALSGSVDKTLRVWDLDSGRCLRILTGHSNEVSSVSVTPDGRRAASGSRDKTLRVWDLESGQRLRTSEWHGGGACGIVTPDGRRAVCGSSDDRLRVWDLESGQCLQTLEGHHDDIFSISVTPDGQRAVSGSWDRTLRVWDLDSGQCLRTMEGHSEVVFAVSVMPGGQRAVSGSRDKTLRVWDLESGQCLQTLEGHNDDIFSVRVTPDGQRAVSGSRDKTLRVWDLASGQCLRVLEGHSYGVWSLSVMGDGRCAISGSSDKTLRVWDLDSGQCVRILEGHRGGINSVRVVPDGRYAISGSVDGTLRVWDLENGGCLALFAAAAPLRALAAFSGTVVTRTSMGEVLVLDLRQLSPGPWVGVSSRTPTIREWTGPAVEVRSLPQ